MSVSDGEFVLADDFISPDTNITQSIPDIEFRLVVKENPSTIPLPLRTTDELIFLAPDAILTDQDIVSAYKQTIGNKNILQLCLDISSTRKLASFCTNHIGEKIGIVIDDELICTLNINSGEQCPGIGVDGNFTETQVNDIVKRINTHKQISQ